MLVLCILSLSSYNRTSASPCLACDCWRFPKGGACSSNGIMRNRALSPVTVTCQLAKPPVRRPSRKNLIDNGVNPNHAVGFPRHQHLGGKTANSMATWRAATQQANRDFKFPPSWDEGGWGTISSETYIPLKKRTCDICLL